MMEIVREGESIHPTPGSFHTSCALGQGIVSESHGCVWARVLSTTRELEAHHNWVNKTD